MPQGIGYDQRITVPTAAVAVTLDDSNDFRMPATNRICRQFVCGLDGAVNIIPLDNADAANVTFPVKAGIVYTMAVRRFRVTGSTVSQTVVAIG